MNLFENKKREPIILKGTSAAQTQMSALNGLLPAVAPKMKIKLEQDIKMLSYGIFGEEQILFELKNSHMPMYVLHDLFLEDNGLTAQIDFLIITEKANFVVECKNLIGDIEINSNGDFIRTINYGKNFVKEGIYSPITQNQRHLELLKSIWSKTGHTLLKQILSDKWFFNFYKGIVVLANPKTVLNDKNAKTEVKQQVIRADQLVRYIRDMNARSKELAGNDKDMERIAQFFLSIHKENTVDYSAKYKNDEDTDAVAVAMPKDATAMPSQPLSENNKAIAIAKDVPPFCPKCGVPMALRTATKGERAGKKFWGCSNYPNCRNIINIE